MNQKPEHDGHAQGVIRVLQDFASYMPTTDESACEDPVLRARQIATHASLKAAAVSASLALPPGPASSGASARPRS